LYFAVIVAAAIKIILAVSTATGDTPKNRRIDGMNIPVNAKPGNASRMPHAQKVAFRNPNLRQHITKITSAAIPTTGCVIGYTRLS